MKRKASGTSAGQRPAKKKPALQHAEKAIPLSFMERKYFTALVNPTTAITQSGTSWAGGELDPTTVNTLFAPTQGDDITNRSGRRVQILSIKIRGTLIAPAQIDQTAADAGTKVRVVLVQDRQTNAAQLNAEDVMQGISSGVVDTFQNPNFFGRFQVWKDKTFLMQNPTITYDGTNLEQSGLIKQWKWNITFKKPIVVHFNATNGGTVADITDNSFHVIALTSNANLAVTGGYVARTVFADVA